MASCSPRLDHLRLVWINDCLHRPSRVSVPSRPPSSSPDLQSLTVSSHTDILCPSLVTGRGPWTLGSWRKAMKPSPSTTSCPRLMTRSTTSARSLRSLVGVLLLRRCTRRPTGKYWRTKSYLGLSTSGANLPDRSASGSVVISLPLFSPSSTKPVTMSPPSSLHATTPTSLHQQNLQQSMPNLSKSRSAPGNEGTCRPASLPRHLQYHLRCASLLSLRLIGRIPPRYLPSNSKSSPRRSS